MSSGGRGRGGKFAKPKRGGGKHFSRNLQPVNADGEVQSMWGERSGKANEDEEDNDSSEEESGTEESDSSEDDPKAAQRAAEANMTREERREAARKRKAAAIAKTKQKNAAPGDLPSDSEEESDSEDDDDEDMPANPNHTAKAAKQASATPQAGAETAPPKRVAKKEVDNLSRREREAIQAQQAKERYQKLHAEGKTDEARADLARLKLVREKRDQEAARKKAEQEERDEEAKAKKEQLERMDRMAERSNAKKTRGAKGKKGVTG